MLSTKIITENRRCVSCITSKLLEQLQQWNLAKCKIYLILLHLIFIYYIHNVNKSVLKIKFYTGWLSFKKKSIFIVLSILKNCSRRMKHMSLIAEKIGHTFRNSIKKNQLFISNVSRVSMKSFNEVLQPHFFAKKMT
jgi:hypothetical protein